MNIYSKLNVSSRRQAVDKANREHILYYIGDELFAGKWRDFKVHFITTDGLVSQKRYWAVPLIYNLKSDPAESHDLLTTGGARHVWVTTVLARYISEKAESMRKYPNIAPGTEFDGYK